MLLFPHTAEFPLYLVSTIAAAPTQHKPRTDPKLEPTGALSMFQDSSTEQLSKLFFKQLPFQKTTRLVPKLLVYPIRRGFWMSVMRTQHESIMKAITHCQERWAPKNTRLQPWACFLFWVTFGGKASRGNHSIKRRRIVSQGEVPDNWQHPLHLEAASVLERWLRLEVG